MPKYKYIGKKDCLFPESNLVQGKEGFKYRSAYQPKEVVFYCLMLINKYHQDKSYSSQTLYSEHVIEKKTFSFGKSSKRPNKI